MQEKYFNDRASFYERACATRLNGLQLEISLIVLAYFIIQREGSEQRFVQYTLVVSAQGITCLSFYVIAMHATLAVRFRAKACMHYGNAIELARSASTCLLLILMVSLASCSFGMGPTWLNVAGSVGAACVTGVLGFATGLLRIQ